MIDRKVVSLYPFAFRTQEPPVGLRKQGEKLVLVYIYMTKIIWEVRGSVCPVLEQCV